MLLEHDLQYMACHFFLQNERNSCIYILTVFDNKMDFDNNADIRALILISQPFPPLPILALRDNSEDYLYMNSHDLQAHLLNISCTNNSQSMHSYRQEKQADIYNMFMHDIKSTRPDANLLYDIYCKHTRSLLSLYIYNTQEQIADIRFQPLNDILYSDSITKHMQEYTKARATITEGNSHDLKNIDNMSFAACLIYITDIVNGIQM